LKLLRSPDPNDRLFENWSRMSGIGIQSCGSR